MEEDLEEIPRRTRLTGEAREEWVESIADAYRSGHSIRDIAKRTGRSYGAVHRMLSEASVELRPRGRHRGEPR